MYSVFISFFILSEFSYMYASFLTSLRFIIILTHKENRTVNLPYLVICIDVVASPKRNRLTRSFVYYFECWMWRYSAVHIVCCFFSFFGIVAIRQGILVIFFCCFRNVRSESYTHTRSLVLPSQGKHKSWAGLQCPPQNKCPPSIDGFSLTRIVSNVHSALTHVIWLTIS